MLRRKSFLALFVTLSLLLAACGPKEAPVLEDEIVPVEDEKPVVEAAETPEGFTAYTDEDGAFSMAHPADWTIQEEYFGTDVMFMSPLTEGDLFQDNFSVLSQALPAGSADLDGYQDMITEQLKAYITDFELLSSDEITVGGMKGQEISYTGVQGESNIAWTQAYFIENDFVYVMTFTAEAAAADSFAETVEEMINTFRVM